MRDDVAGKSISLLLRHRCALSKYIADHLSKAGLEPGLSFSSQQGRANNMGLLMPPRC